MGSNKIWATKQKARQIRVDAKFLELIEREYPNARNNPERTRRLMDKLLGNESNKTTVKEK